MGRCIRCVQRTQISIRRRIGDAASGVLEGTSALLVKLEARRERSRCGGARPILLLQRNRRVLFPGSTLYLPISRFQSPVFFSGTGSMLTACEASPDELTVRGLPASVVKCVSTVGSTARTLFARVIAT